MNPSTIALRLACVLAVLASFVSPFSLKAHAEDSAYHEDTIKSWTKSESPGKLDQSFLNRLSWKDYNVGGGYVIRTGIIFDTWIAAMQWKKNGELLLTEYTPPSEYITLIDPLTSQPTKEVHASKIDNVPVMAFSHEKLNDHNYHMYSVYALRKNGPELVYKSAGKLGDWRQALKRPATETWSGSTRH